MQGEHANLHAVGDHEVTDGGMVHPLRPLNAVVNVIDFDRHAKCLAVVGVGVVGVIRIVELEAQAAVRDLVCESLQEAARSVRPGAPTEAAEATEATEATEAPPNTRAHCCPSGGPAQRIGKRRSNCCLQMKCPSAGSWRLLSAGRGF